MCRPPGGSKRRHDVVTAAARFDSTAIEPDRFLYVRDLKAAWWTDRLMGEVEDPRLRIEVVTEGDLPIRQLAPDIAEGATFHLYGKEVNPRARPPRGAVCRIAGARRRGRMDRGDRGPRRRDVLPEELSWAQHVRLPDPRLLEAYREARRQVPERKSVSLIWRTLILKICYSPYVNIAQPEERAAA